MNKIYYRICERKGDEYLSLFHGTQHSRRLPKGQWLNADVKVVQDGSHGQTYISGFHVLPSYAAALAFFERHFKIKQNRVIVACYARCLRPKTKSREGVLLAARIKIIGEMPSIIGKVPS